MLLKEIFTIMRRAFFAMALIWADEETMGVRGIVYGKNIGGPV